MNEVTRIHLARTAYEIDVDAKKELEQYCKDVKQSLGHDSEIYDDVEVRMTEILAERGVGRDDVITLADINAIRAQLGEPRDFAGDETGDTASEDWRDNLFTRGKDDGGPRKRYYRDEDNGIFGGVIAGFAAYTGWDVTLLRILTVIFTIFPSWGTLIIVYIVVWVIAPAAKTTGEKLEMRGKPITLDSIKNAEFTRNAEKNAKQFAEDVKEKVSGIKDKAKAKELAGKAAAKEMKANAKTYQESIKADIDNEIRAYYGNYGENRRRVNPAAAVVGVILHVFGFIALASAIAFSVLVFVVLIQNNFSHEVWLWLAAGSAVVAMFVLVGFFMATGQGLIDTRKRWNLAQEVAGTLGSFFLFGIMAGIFQAIWLGSIPENYELPNPASQQIRRITNDEVCRVNNHFDFNLRVKGCDD
jgi:phage shock protein PspC (stress-responsive transcriptional regulator)